MAVELIIAPEAQQDLDEAYSWYEDRRPGLGEEFLGCVDACIQQIRRTPELHAKAHEDYRRALVRRFLLPGPRSLARIITAMQPNDNLSFVRPAGVSAGRVRKIQLLLTVPWYLTLLRFYGIMRQHDGVAMV